MTRALAAALALALAGCGGGDAGPPAPAPAEQRAIDEAQADVIAAQESATRP